MHHRSEPWLLAAAALVFTVAGCSDDDSPTLPERASLGGEVVLVGGLTDPLNVPLGERRLEDADGVLVELLAAGAAIDSARTVDGRYRFDGLEPGNYRIRSWVDPAAPVTSDEVPVGSTGAATAGTLTLQSSDALSTYPNPGHDEGVAIEFTTTSEQTYEIDVMTLSGKVVWRFSQAAPAGFYHVHWAGHDMNEREADAGAYWIVARLAEQTLYDLVFWPGHEESSGNCGHIEADGLVLAHHEEPIVTCWHEGCHGDLRVAAGDSTHGYAVTFLHADSTSFAVADSCPENHLSWTVADTNLARVDFSTGKNWTIRVIGKQAGTTSVVLNGWHQEHIHYVSPAIPIVVE